VNEATPPTGGNSPSTREVRAGQEFDRGLLDLSVELSAREITAGKQFALYVVVKNPFTTPVWIDRVHVSLPSDLKRAIDRQHLRDEATKSKEKRKSQSAVLTEIKSLQAGIERLGKNLTNLIWRSEAPKYSSPNRGVE
jgi:hypothetical protein